MQKYYGQLKTVFQTLIIESLELQFQNQKDKTTKLNLKLIIGPSTNEDFRIKLFEIATNNDKFKPGKSLSKKWNQIYSISIISKEEITEKSFDDLKIILDEKLNKFFLENGEFYTIREVLNDIMSLS